MSDEPAPAVSEEFARLLTVLRELRERCPWDREQSIASLGKHLVEEAYEALDAIERDDPGAIIDELGDLIAQAIAVAVIGEEQQRFDDLYEKDAAVSARALSRFNIDGIGVFEYALKIAQSLARTGTVTCTRTPDAAT